MNLPKKHISVSQVEMYLRCPMQYFFRYCEQIVRPPSVALIEGSSGHVALAINNQQKIETHEDLPTRQVVECFSDTFSDKSQEIENWENDSKDEVIKRSGNLIAEYMEQTAPGIQPVAVETEYTVDLNIDDSNVPVLMYVDLEHEMLSDYKVVGRTKSQGDADNSLQLATYGVATGAKEAEFICLVKSKNPKINRVKTSLTESKTQWAAEVIGSVARAISKGVFPVCDPTHWCCSERFCGYWRLCRGKER